MIKDAVQYFKEFLHNYSIEKGVNIRYVNSIKNNKGNTKKKFCHGQYISDKKNNIYTIEVLNKYKNSIKELFILCHEIGHFLIDMDGIKLPIDMEEDLCDTYFKQFLKYMPLSVQMDITNKLGEENK